MGRIHRKVRCHTVDHLCSQVLAFNDTVVADHYGDDHKVCAGLVQASVGFKDPANGHIRSRLAVDFSRSESIIILKNSRHLIVLDNKLEHLTVDVVALQGLASFSTAENIAIVAEPGINDADAWGVLEVTKGEALLDVLGGLHISMHKEVSKRPKQWQEDHFVVLRDQFFDHIDRLCVYPETLNSVSNHLVEVPEEGATAS